jgi:hypothetical protein
MNETGKEKLKLVSDQILKIWNTVNDGHTVSANTAVNFEVENE